MREAPSAARPCRQIEGRGDAVVGLQVLGRRSPRSVLGKVEPDPAREIVIGDDRRIAVAVVFLEQRRGCFVFRRSTWWLVRREAHADPE